MKISNLRDSWGGQACPTKNSDALESLFGILFDGKERKKEAWYGMISDILYSLMAIAPSGFNVTAQAVTNMDIQFAVLRANLIHRYNIKPEEVKHATVFIAAMVAYYT